MLYLENKVIKKIKNILSVFMSLVILIQIVAVPSTYGVLPNAKNQFNLL